MIESELLGFKSVYSVTLEDDISNIMISLSLY